MVDRYTYVLNTGKNASTNLNSYGYATKGTAKDIAFTDCSVNPIIKSTGFDVEDDTFPEVTLSANFFEIRNAPYDGLISNDEDTTIVNRILPSGSPLDIENYGTNQQKTKSFKIRTYNNGSGQKVVGSGGIGMDLELYDYFVLINPEVTGNDGAVSIRPHFARITQVVTFDEYGDGIEFEPKYVGAIPEEANIEIYKGPSVNDTEVMAVSYGLRGDKTASSVGLSDKYDVSNTVSKPTWYFYNDRLVTNNQLDYDTKYTLTTCRWYKDFYSITGIITNSSSKYQTSSNSTFTVTSFVAPVTRTDVIPGQTLYGYNPINSTRIRLGNIVSVTGSSSPYTIKLDTLRSTLSSGDYVGQLGRTLHQTVFKTERGYGTIINDLGTINQDAVLVDNIQIKDNDAKDYDFPAGSYTTSLGVDSEFDPSVWKDCIRNYSRSNTNALLTGDYNSTHASYNPTGSATFLHANLTGARRHLYYKDAQLKNGGIGTVLESRVNSPKEKISQLAKAKTLDQSGIQHLKLKEEDNFIVRNSVFSGTLGEYKLPYTATSETISSLYHITLNQIGERFDYRNDSFLKVNDIIRVGSWLYRISGTHAPAGNKQIIVVNKKKKLNGTTFAAIDLTSLESFTGAEIFVRSWNGGLAGALPIDTEVVYGGNAFQRLTINGNTITKKETSLYNNKLVLLEGQFYGQDIPIDYGDSIHQHIKLQKPNKTLYQPNPISFLYYITGKFAIDEEIFSGDIEDIESKNEDGYISYTIAGRDSMSRLLTNNTSKNLNHSDDVIYSTLTPIPPDGTNDVTALSKVGANNNVIEVDGLVAVNKYDLIFNSNNELVGEVLSADDADSDNDTEITLKGYTGAEYLTTALKWVKMLGNNYLVSTKALSSNIIESKNPTDLGGAGEKGLIFNDGLQLNYNSSRVQSVTELLDTSATSTSTQEDGSLGYDLTYIQGISPNKDSDFAFKLALEKELEIEYKKVHTVSSPSYFNIIDFNSKERNNTTIKVAPTFPVVLGSIETNTSDTRISDINSYIYVVNRNIPSGGILHSLLDTHTDYYLPKQTFRYMGLQEFDEGRLGHPSQKMMGAAPAYKIDMLGNKITLNTEDKTGWSVINSIDVKTGRPIEGSNILDTNYVGYASDFNSRLPLDYVGVDTYWTGTGTDIKQIKVNELEDTFTSCKTYELLALGDIYPDSKLRHNNIGNSLTSKEFNSFGMLLESDGSVGSTISHQNYPTNTTTETNRSDANYERIEIESATKAPSDTRRFGIMRLVEQTFDWHFNPVDYENMVKSPARKNYFDYIRFKGNSLGSGLITVEEVTTTTHRVKFSVQQTGLVEGDWLYVGGNIKVRVNTTQTYNANTWYNINESGGVYEKLWVYATTDAQSFFIVNDRKVFKTYTDGNGVGINDMTALNDNKMQLDMVYLAVPNINKDYFKFMNLIDHDEIDKFDAHNIFIPLITNLAYNGSQIAQNLKVSPFHEVTDWGETGNYYHFSRIVNALNMGTFGDYSDNIQFKLGRQGHLYENCTALFKNFQFATKQYKNLGLTLPENPLFTSTSSPLQLDTSTRYIDYKTNSFPGSGIHDDLDQHSQNLMVNTVGTSFPFSLCGTKTKVIPLDLHGNREKKYPGDAGFKPHFEGSNDFQYITVNSSFEVTLGESETLGNLYQAQMVVKPKFYLKGSSTTNDATYGTVTYSNANKTIEFTLDDYSKHHWLSFVPTLRGSYAVSDKTGVKYLPNLDTSLNHVRGGKPALIAKITKHEVDFTGNEVKHKLTFDTAMTGSGEYFRLMRIAETTFKDTPQSIKIGHMFDSGLRYEDEPKNLRTGEHEKKTGDFDNDNLVYQEGLYSMYLLLDIDNMASTNKFIERRNIGEEIEVFPLAENHKTTEYYITDGKNNQLKTIYLSVNDTNGVELQYEGELTGNGVVSFGETFTIESPSTPKMSRPTRAYIGSTISIGTDAEKAIEEILNDNEIDIDTTEKNIVYTNNIASTTTSTTVTCIDNVSGLSDGDILYNQDRKIIGKISTNGITDKVITLGYKYYDPLPHDEITKYSRKPLISNVKFNENNIFDSVNLLATKTGLDYSFVDKKIKIRDKANYNNIRKYSLRYKDGKNLVSVDNNKSLFDRATKIIVIGDNVKAVAEIPTTKKVRTIKHVDSNIKNRKEAERKALQLLEFHRKPYRKVTLTLQKKGLELMRAGDILTLNFPNHDIPPDDYEVFEIENMMDELTKVTVGTFNKTIAERLAEINISQDKNFTNLFTKELGSIITTKQVPDATLMSETSLKYIQTGTSGAIIGF